METGTFYPDGYHIQVCLLLVFCKLHSWSAWSFFIWHIPRGGHCLLLPGTGYARVCVTQYTHILSFVYKSCNGLLPIKYRNYFTFTKDKHYYPTRSSNDYNLYRTNVHKACRANALINRGPKYWNALPIDIKSAKSFGTFRLCLKEHLCHSIDAYIAVSWLVD